MTDRTAAGDIPEIRSADGKRLILIVDDEDVNREILSAVLSEEYESLHAETGTEAIRIIHERAETLSLVLLDLILPDMYGLDILRRIKADPECSRIPVIVMTSDTKSEVDSLDLGASDFISKPYPIPEVIRARVRRTIELSENRDLIRWTERDPLTGLLNRDYFYRYARKLDLYHKDGSMDAIVLDVNHFHMINERYGKAYADGILQRIGTAIRDFCGESGGIACRREADTFLVYCPHLPEYSAFLEKVTAAAGGENRGRIQIRLGVYPDVDKTLEIERCFDHAKMAADLIRSSYTKSISLYDAAMHEAEIFSERLLDEFQDALDQKQFLVYYQPKYDIRPDQPVLYGAEALVRWKHPELGMISPGIFIPLFEGNGLIRELDDYVWREAARQIREWKTKFGFAVPVSVNVSRVDMMDTDLIENLKDLVAEFGLDYSDLHLEITESAYTQDAEQIIETVTRLRELGFPIEMDDFGSGYSSLNMISTLPIDALKLDMLFIRTAFGENGNPRMLEVTVDISDLLGVPMIAEGVETEQQMLTLKKIGCDIVQGYFFSRPVPPEEFERFIP